MGSKVAQSKTLAVQPTEFLFKEGEKILCFHNSVDRLYEGIIQKAEVRNQGKKKKYLVSFIGGKNGSWDQWLSENLILKCDDAGLARKEELSQAQEEFSQAHKAKFSKKVTKRTEEGSSCSKTDPSSNNIDKEEIAAINSVIDPNEQNRDPKSSEDGRNKVESPTILAAPSPFTLVTQVKYHNLLVKIFSGPMETIPRQFFFEPLVLLDPKSIVSNSCSHGSLKQDFVRITIQMWNLEIRSKVLERLRSLKSLNNVEIQEEDICVMPFEDVQLVCKSGSLPSFISLADEFTPYLRSDEDLDFYLLVDESSSANLLAHDIQQNPKFYLINKWKMKLECRGFALESGTTSAESTLSQRLTRVYTISICSKDVTTSFPSALSAGSSPVAKSLVKLPPGETVDTYAPSSSSGSFTLGSASTLVAKEIDQSILADTVSQPPHSSETCIITASQLVSDIKCVKSLEGVLLSWKPLKSTDGEISEYSVYVAVKGSSATLSGTVGDEAGPSHQLPYVRVYCGPSPCCTVPNSSLVSARIDRTIVPAIIFLIAARNEKGYGPANQVVWLLDSSSEPISALGAIERVFKTAIATDVSVNNSSRLASASRSSREVFPAEPLVPPFDAADSPVFVQEAIARSNLPEVDQQPPSSSQICRPASALEDIRFTDQLVTISCLKNYPSLIKEEPADGMETSLAALAEAQVFTTQVVDVEEEDDQPLLSNAPTTKTTLTPATSHANLTTASPSFYPKSAGVLAAHIGSKIAPLNPASKLTRCVFWQPWSTPETSTTTTTSVNEKVETYSITTSNGTETVAVPSTSVATTQSQVQTMVGEHIMDQITAPIKRSNPFQEQTNPAPKRHKSDREKSLLFRGSPDVQVVLSARPSTMDSNQLVSLTAPSAVFEEEKLSSQHREFQKFAETLVDSYSGPKTRSSLKNFSDNMNDFIRSFAAVSNGEPHLLPGAIAIKIINSITQRVGSVQSAEFRKVKPLIVDVCVCVLNQLYLNHVELAEKEEEDSDRVSANQTDAYDLIKFFLTAWEAQFADCINEHPELLLFAADCCILNCYTLNDDGAIVSLESDLIGLKVECVNNSFFFLKKFHMAMERVKISDKFAEKEQRILGLVRYVKKQLGFSPKYDENNVIGSQNDYHLAFQKNREAFQAAIRNK